MMQDVVTLNVNLDGCVLAVVYLIKFITMKQKNFLLLSIVGIFFLVCVVYDFIIKNVASYNSNSNVEYLKLYYAKSIYSINNIYVLTLLNIFFGIVAILIFFYCRKYFKWKHFFNIMIVVGGILTFLNLFSLL